MSEKSHWPFGKNAGDEDDLAREHAAERERQRQIEAEQARLAHEVANRQHPRNNRPIVGETSTHQKKRGLS
jgi:hypothetical protein